jgi:hypothetical protein
MIRRLCRVWVIFKVSLWKRAGYGSKGVKLAASPRCTASYLLATDYNACREPIRLPERNAPESALLSRTRGS